LSDRDLARHRSPQRPVTFLTDAGEAVSGRIAVVGRTGAVLAASTGMLATGGLPASGASAASAPVTSADASAGTRTMLGGVSARLLSAPVARSTPLSAPMTATVTFETSAFRASPAPRRMISPAKVTALIRAVPARRTTAPAEAAPNRQAAPAKAAPVKAAPGKSAEESSTRTSAAPPKRSKHVEAPKSSKKTDAAPKRSKHAAPPKHSKPVEAPKKKPRASKPATKAPAGSARGSAVLAVAARYVGTPYVYGGSTPRGFDCSGFTSYVYRQLGISLPRTANQQMQATRRVSRSQARAGDLVFFVSANRAYHVGIYAGKGKMYDSPRSGKRVSKRAIWDAAVVFGRVTR
jgi:cell wall-associated NlpC family hydrolase